MNKPGIILWIIILCITGGCATILQGKTQEVRIVSSPPHARVTVNGVGYSTPARLVLPRDHKQHEIVVEAEGYDPVTLTLQRGTNNLLWLNVVNLGLGWMVDSATGAAYEIVPSQVHVDFERQVIK